MASDVLVMGFELLSVLEDKHKTYLIWKHSDEECEDEERGRYREER